MRRLAAAALLPVLVALVLAGCGGGGTTTKVIERTVTEKVPVEPQGSKEPASDQEATEEADGQPSRIVHLRTFRSPSGNVGCAMYGGGARCDIRKRGWKPPPHPSSCSGQVDYGQGLTVSHAGEASFVCAGDTTLDPGASSLAYGTASEVGGSECISRKEGVTCVNQAGHGFFISVQSYEVF